ncbi:adenosylmethionine decarboxylase [Burkholderia pyrrocinia]|uniref:S-adenosylmethionine decarboxylase proenzyme n=1 Tax=Burkholderia pyrrocinia TaxID=60550 RepID=A0A2Z5N4F9_BURPY|nr:adenosylmethionine decarboxylase [Burkholderia pyrrocinia]AXF24431.1 adenosylmethionine decarboxylase [Burkholderia pyrrocinia]
METSATHLLCELSDCDESLLADYSYVKKACEMAALDGGASIIVSNGHKFSPQGVSVLLFLAESHLSIHTWPEHKYAAVDVYMCGAAASPHRAIDRLVELLGAKRVNIREFIRGRQQGAEYLSVERLHDGSSSRERLENHV